MEENEITNIYELIDLSKKHAKFFNLPNSPENLDIEVNRSWNYLIEIFPDIKLIVTELALNMGRLNIDVPRGRYLFGWLFYVTQITTLIRLNKSESKIFIDKGYYINDFASYLKLLGVVFDIVIDDIGDEYKGNSIVMLGEVKKILISFRYNSTPYKIDSSNLIREEILYLEFLQNLLLKLFQLITQLDRGILKEKIIGIYLKTVKSCEVKHRFNTYIKDNNLKDGFKLHRYIQKTHLFNYTMHITANTYYDLLVLNYVNKSNTDIPVYEKISYYLETLGRIGDDLSTWKRETKRNDYTSEVARNLIFKFNLIKNLENTDEIIMNKIYNKQFQKYNLFYRKLSTLIKNSVLSNEWINAEELARRYLAGFTLQIYSTGRK